MQDPKQNLIAGIETLCLSVDQQMIDQLLSLLQLLQKWNKAFNLTTVTNLQKMVVWHLLDSLALSPYINGNRILDVGTGAGFPGLPLAIINPDQHFVLLDSTLKKTRFVQQAILELGIDNVEVVHKRIQDYQPECQFNTVFARAVSSLADMVDNVARLVAEDGKILLPKGQYPYAEIDVLNDCHYSVIKLDIPGMDAQRHLVSID
ncbi:MAG: 16S rRNA (guanine(527)-N(7))-methyltransferase RsmG [Methylococcales bacterium]